MKATAGDDRRRTSRSTEDGRPPVHTGSVRDGWETSHGHSAIPETETPEEPEAAGYYLLDNGVLLFTESDMWVPVVGADFPEHSNFVDWTILLDTFGADMMRSARYVGTDHAMLRAVPKERAPSATETPDRHRRAGYECRMLSALYDHPTGSAIEYMWRHESKGGVADLRKALDWLEWERDHRNRPIVASDPETASCILHTLMLTTDGAEHGFWTAILHDDRPHAIDTLKTLIGKETGE